MSKFEYKFRVWDGLRMYDHDTIMHGIGFDWCIAGGGLMQYTGLKDFDGKEIYEGDVLRSKSGFNYKVVRRYSGFVFTRSKRARKRPLEPRFIWFRKMRVVGHIYDGVTIVKEETPKRLPKI